jgi:hypothetical protein
MTGFATRATLLPKLFKNLERWLMPTYRKVSGNRVAAVAKSLVVSADSERARWRWKFVSLLPSTKEHR